MLLISLGVGTDLCTRTGGEERKKEEKKEIEEKSSAFQPASSEPLAAWHIIMNTLRQHASKLELNRADRAPAVVRVSL